MQTLIEKSYRSLVKTIGWSTLIILAVFTFKTTLPTIKSPFPFSYGEGIMMWGTQEIDNGRWPYGNIEDVPSRYSAYGPATYTLAAGLSQIFPKDNPLRYAEAGRTLNLIAWIIAGLALGLSFKNTTLSIGAILFALLTPISTTSFFWAFRIDGVLFACQALIALTLLRAPTKALIYLLPALVTLLTFIKPPSALDLIPLTLIALALRSPSIKENVQSLWKPLGLSILVAPTIFFTVDALTGFTMSNNILWLQAQSGIIDAIHYSYNLHLWEKTETLPITLSAAAYLGWAILSQKQAQHGGILILAITLSITFATLTTLKEGADINYTFPSLIPLTLVASKLLSEKPNLSLPLLLTTLTLFGIQTTLQRSYEIYLASNPEVDAYQEFDAIKKAHEKENFLSEEIFYSVAAGKQPLVTDIFQTTIHYQNKKKSPSKAIEKMTGGWGRERLATFLSGGNPTYIQDEPPQLVISPEEPSESKHKIKHLQTAYGPYAGTFLISPTKKTREILKKVSWKHPTPNPHSLTIFLTNPLPLLISLYLIALQCLLHPFVKNPNLSPHKSQKTSFNENTHSH